MLINERPVRLSRWRAGGLLEDSLFIAAAVLSLLLAAVVLRKGVSSWADLAYLLVFYLVLAYLALPRIHRILTTLYVPDYFIGRTQTGDGLLGDPVNLALVGEGDQIREAMEQAGWVEADPVNLASALRIVSSALLRRSYAHAPVSPLFLFGRMQDFAYQQEVAGNPSKRHHVRFWHCPPGWLLPGGRRVEWLAAGTYDRAVGLSLFTFQVTHKIAADIDVERDHIIGTLQKGPSKVSVDLIENFSTGYHSRNGGGDAVHTDGALPIVDVSSVEVPWAGEREEQMAVLEDVGRRPLSVAIAFLVTLVSIAVQLVNAVIVLRQDFPQTLAEAGSSRQSLVIFLVIALLVWVAAMIAFAVAVFQGVNLARLVLLVMVTASLSVELGHALVREVPSAFSLIRMTADVLVVFALTSLSARQWTKHQVSNRRARRHRERD
ncbi:MAG: LssY C-terminal domain-containing protein [Propionibacterium sp.]